ncbi:MAG: ACT domain-containing protein [Deltaproteobacteria bacterium]
MKRTNLTLSLLPENYSICRLGPEADIPPWALAGNFYSLTRTKEELSLVCSEEFVPEGVQCEKGWRCILVSGPLDFSLTGILASLTNSLAEAGISVLAISTFDTDYFLVKADNLKRAVLKLEEAGHRFC